MQFTKVAIGLSLGMVMVLAAPVAEPEPSPTPTFWFFPEFLNDWLSGSSTHSQRFNSFTEY